MIARILNWVRNNWLLLIIAAGAFALRASGIYFDYPVGVNHIWDEIFSVSWMLDAIDQKTIFTAVPYQYPLLLPLLYLPGLMLRLAWLALTNQAYSAEALKQLLVIGGMGQLFVVVRWYSVVFGTASVFLIESIFRRIFQRRGAGLAAAAAYAVAFIPMFMAHWGKTHTVMAFFILAAVWAAIRFEADKNNKWLYVCALSAASAFSIHYLGIFALVVPLVLWLWNRGEITTSTALKVSIAACLFCALFYGLNFVGLFGMWLNNSGYVQSGGSAGMGHAGTIERFYYLFRDIFRLDPILLSFGVAALIFGAGNLAKDVRARYLLAALLADWLLMSIVIAWPNMSRWLLAFSALLLPLGAAWVWLLLSRKTSVKIATVVLAIALLPGLYLDFRWLGLLKANTRLLAEKALEGDLAGPAGAYSFDMYLDAPLSYQAAVWHLANNNRGASKKLNYAIEHPEEFKNAGINLYYDYGYNRFDSLAGSSTDFVIVSYWKNDNVPGVLPSGASRSEMKDLLDRVRQTHKLELYQSIYPTSDKGLIASGVDDYLNNPLSWQTLIRLNKSGPFVDIYRIIK